MRVRILATVTLLLALSAGVTLLILREVLFDRLEAEVKTSLEQEMEEFVRLRGGLDPLTGQPFDDDHEALFELYFEREVPDEGESLLSFLDGELFLSERAQDAATTDLLGDAFDYWLSLEEQTAGVIETPAGNARFIAQPLGGNDLFVVANFPQFERDEITEALQAAGATQAGAFVVAFLLALALAGRVLSPLRSLAETARTISDTDFTRRIPVRGNDEATQIARAFNDMLGRLEQAFAMQRRFLDDAGHELRAPLSIISGHVELLELDTDPQARRETIELVLDEIDRMNRIVNDLLVLAQAEQPDFVTRGPVDLADLTEDVRRKATALGPRDWRLDRSADVIVQADAQRLTQALMQLAANALQYTEDGAVIRMGSEVSSGKARLWVHDDGTGVAAEDADRIFQRFVRGSRRKPGGAGLGLSIVRAIAEAHGGEVRLDRSVTRGARFEIVLPIDGEAAQP